MSAILIVGDVEALRERSPLQREGVAVIAARNEEEAVALAGAAAPFDLALVDTQMPGLDPVACCLALRAAVKPPRVVALMAAPVDQPRFSGAPCDGFVSRPLTQARLLEAVRRWAPVPERAEERIPFAVKVDYRRAGAAGSGYAHDLSVDGMFVATRDALAAGDRIEVEFELPPPEARPMRAVACVVRAGESGAAGRPVTGVGVRFETIASSDRIALARWLRGRTGA